MSNTQLLACRIDAFHGIEIRRKDAQVDVGHERPQHQNAVTLFHVFGHFLDAHRA